MAEMPSRIRRDVPRRLADEGRMLPPAADGRTDGDGRNRLFLLGLAERSCLPPLHLSTSRASGIMRFSRPVLCRPFSLLVRLLWRLYARAFRPLENRRSPFGVLMGLPLPNALAPHFLLILLALVAALNFLLDHSEHQLVLLSTTLFSRSAIYPPNTAVILFNADDHLRLKRELLCTASNGTFSRTSRVRVRYAYQPVGVCKWTAFICVCPALPGLLRLALSETSANALSSNIPFRLAYSSRVLQVATCFSPLFYMERWQIVLATVQIYRHFGVGLQVFYIQSILAEIMDVLELYRRKGFVELEPWPSIALDKRALAAIGFDPNTELDWRNQASAHTDCLLKYKEAAEFIIVGDLDDVLLPRLGANYIDEFRVLSSMFPSAAGFTYTRFNTELVSAHKVEEYSLERLLKSARISAQNETGKYAVNTSRVETAWLHYPGIRQRWTKMVGIPPTVNLMVHLRNWTISTDHKRRRRQGNLAETGRQKRRAAGKPMGGEHVTQMAQLLSDPTLRQLQLEFEQILSAHRDLFRRLPTVQNYLPLIVDCYNRIFYSHKDRKPDSCPGPVKCRLPDIAGLRCRIASVGTLVRRRISWRTVLLFPMRRAQFETRQNGCSLH